MDYAFLYKLILIGDSGVGKTSLLEGFKEVSNVPHSTIGVDFHIHNVKSKNRDIRLHIWDSAGQEQFQSIVQSYYRNIDGCFIVYDCTNRESFNNVERWVSDVNDKAGPLLYMLVCNKIDLSREVTTEEGKELAENKNMEYIETSTVEKINVGAVFQQAISKFLENKPLLTQEDLQKKRLLLGPVVRKWPSCF